MDKKIIGFVLLAVGVLSIGWGGWQSYNIFMLEQPAPQVFRAQEAAVESDASAGGDLMGQLVSGMLRDQMENLIPSGSATTMLNLAAWSVFMMIVIMAGGKIATIGVRLMAIDTFIRKNELPK